MSPVRKPTEIFYTYITRRITAVPLLKRRKWSRNSSDGSGVASGEMVVRLRAEKRAVGRRMVIALGGCIGPRPNGIHGSGYSPECQERAIELCQMRVKMLFPNA